jgi:hypothetical protein
LIKEAAPAPAKGSCCSLLELDSDELPAELPAELSAELPAELPALEEAPALDVAPLEALDELLEVDGVQAAIPNTANATNGIRIFFRMLMLLSEISPRDITKQQRRKLSIIIFFDFWAFLPRKRFFRGPFCFGGQTRLTTKR